VSASRHRNTSLPLIVCLIADAPRRPIIRKGEIMGETPNNPGQSNQDMSQQQDDAQRRQPDQQNLQGERQPQQQSQNPQQAQPGQQNRQADRDRAAEGVEGTGEDQLNEGITGGVDTGDLTPGRTGDGGAER
jgi:hypothetical protein